MKIGKDTYEGFQKILKVESINVRLSTQEKMQKRRSEPERSASPWPPSWKYDRRTWDSRGSRRGNHSYPPAEVQRVTMCIETKMDNIENWDAQDLRLGNLLLAGEYGT